jgi:hypothetical protein
MSLIAQPKLDPVQVRYGDVIRFPDASGYDFVDPTNTHLVGVLRMNPGHADNPHVIGLVGTAANEWEIPSPGFTDEYVVDGNPNLVAIGSDIVLHVNPTVFPVVDEYYLVAVCDDSLSGPDRHIVDLKVIYVEKAQLDIFDSTSAALELTTLDVALGLAGDNAKMRKAEFSQGQLAEFQLALYSTAIQISLEEADLDSDTGLQHLIDVTHIMDNLGDVHESTTRKTL